MSKLEPDFPTRLAGETGVMLLKGASDEVMRMLQEGVIEQHLHFVELFAGFGGTTRKVREMGLAGVSFDRKHNDPEEDVCTMLGKMLVYFCRKVITKGRCTGSTFSTPCF